MVTRMRTAGNRLARGGWRGGLSCSKPGAVFSVRTASHNRYAMISDM